MQEYIVTVRTVEEIFIKAKDRDDAFRKVLKQTGCDEWDIINVDES